MQKLNELKRYGLIRPEDKQTVLECFDPMLRIETVTMMLDHEAEILECDAMINSRVRERTYIIFEEQITFFIFKQSVF